MWSNVVYFSTWRPHENWVSKTRFTTHINIEEPSTHIREKKNPEETRRTQKPRQHAAWVACDLGGALPGVFSPRCAPPRSHATWAAHKETRQRATQAVCCLGFFHPGISGWWSVDSFSPLIWLLWLWISEIFYFIFLCISACMSDSKFF